MWLSFIFIVSFHQQTPAAITVARHYVISGKRFRHVTHIIQRPFSDRMCSDVV